jgi:hypothetical protein
MKERKEDRMFELIIMTEEMKKKLDPDVYSAYSCVIDKSANVIIWQGYVHWTERDGILL